MGKWFVPLLLAASSVSAQAPTLHLSAPAELRVGERALLAVSLALPPQAGAPLLLTQSAEGEALEVVRGRLLRSDARAAGENPLHFDIPVLARAPGTSIVRVHALAYLCEVEARPPARERGSECRAVESEARISVVVLAR